MLALQSGECKGRGSERLVGGDITLLGERKKKKKKPKKKSRVWRSKEIRFVEGGGGGGEKERGRKRERARERGAFAGNVIDKACSGGINTLQPRLSFYCTIATLLAHIACSARRADFNYLHPIN